MYKYIGRSSFHRIFLHNFSTFSWGPVHNHFTSTFTTLQLEHMDLLIRSNQFVKGKLIQWATVLPLLVIIRFLHVVPWTFFRICFNVCHIFKYLHNYILLSHRLSISHRQIYIIQCPLCTYFRYLHVYLHYIKISQIWKFLLKTPKYVQNCMDGVCKYETCVYAIHTHTHGIWTVFEKTNFKDSLHVL